MKVIMGKGNTMKEFTFARSGIIGMDLENAMCTYWAGKFLVFL